MKIAVTYDNGTVFQHFGRTEHFKIYEIDNKQITSSEVIGNNGIGHEALADYLKECGVEVLICGGMGPGAQNALAEAGITVYSDAEGDADKAVQAYLNGKLASTGANCNHHEHEEESCSGCEGQCESGCGGCPGHQVLLEGPNAGKTVRVHYRGTLNDGTQFDSSYDRGTPLEFICGTGMMIRGFDEAVLFMNQGDKIKIHLMPEDAYGMPNPNAIFTVKISDIAGTENLTVGQRVVLRTDRGYPIPVRVTAKDDTTITFDSNHEMAGKELNFEIELLEIL